MGPGFINGGNYVAQLPMVGIPVHLADGGAGK